MPGLDSILKSAPADAARELPQTVLAALREAIDGLRFGVVQLTVHEGRIVQLDVTERRRF